MIQRGAANVRLPNVVSALTIVSMPSRLHAVLTDSRVLATARTLKQIGQLAQATFLAAVAAQQLHQTTIDFLKRTAWTEVEDAIDQIIRQTQGTATSLTGDEFARLTRAASVGAPAVLARQVGAPPLFEVPLSQVRRFPGPASRLEFRVSPVTRLRMVMVQKSYVRPVDPQSAQEVGTGFQWSDQTWYPGVELFGEGLFIDLADTTLRLAGPRTLKWIQRYNASSGSVGTHPTHVWWHSISHRLLRALSIESGYSSAAIRERVYFTFNSQGQERGGLLLYTVQPGGDGTLGGLVALSGRFDRVLDLALRDIDCCSNDPLCEEAGETGPHGSACYSCMLVSETSCEHRNQGLDRLMLVENAP